MPCDKSCVDMNSIPKTLEKVFFSCVLEMLVLISNTAFVTRHLETLVDMSVFPQGL